MSVGSGTSLTNIQIKSKLIGGIEFPDGSSLRVEYVNGKKEGEGLVISSKKTKLAKLNYHEDKLNGFCVFFNSDGEKTKECLFEKNVQNGWGREFENGNVLFE